MSSPATKLLMALPSSRSVCSAISGRLTKRLSIGLRDAFTAANRMVSITDSPAIIINSWPTAATPGDRRVMTCTASVPLWQMLQTILLGTGAGSDVGRGGGAGSGGGGSGGGLGAGSMAGTVAGIIKTSPHRGHFPRWPASEAGTLKFLSQVGHFARITAAQLAGQAVKAMKKGRSPSQPPAAGEPMKTSVSFPIPGRPPLPDVPRATHPAGPTRSVPG